MTTIIYLHGFLSSPQSEKAQLTRAYFAEHHPECRVVIPELPNQPSLLRGTLEQLITQEKLALGDGVKVIGSSMGGFLATWLVETCGGKAVCINPAVRPFELLMDYLGTHVNPYTQAAFTIEASDMALIRTFDTPTLRRPTDYKVLLQTADETLDYREAEAKYLGADLVIEQGGDHSFVGFKDHLPAIAKFLLD
ncbi:alpha/beta fold hydrolase [Alteromonas sediminis]|uniref:Alpha/beta fold hydrolase n=1 Tax=Alteromonas sediminis TaxID=2259342 RepID=A0A3N5Y6E1_9ALTE|nr:YqiA/YcfP family alpha/beta fold hydrolase [Alteromonas sediminis]RPJ66019.1 alpha/beta fold hydrolase [Alteromonas sediminis]